MAHTPGPWVVSTETDSDGDVLVLGISAAANGQCIVKTDDGVYPPELPDAHLIAAAPELLAACKAALQEMVTIVAPRHSFTDAVDALDAAIAKAEGR